jgi:hypothetical protein
MKLQVTKYLAIELTEPNELFELISDEDKIDFCQYLSCDRVIFKHVADQIVHGCTEGGYHAAISFGYKPSEPLDVAIREVSKLSGDIAKREIESLEARLEWEHLEKEKYMNMYYDLYHKTR